LIVDHRAPFTVTVVQLSFREYYSRFGSASLIGVAAEGEGIPARHGRIGQARTRLARRAVIDASRDLFVEKGYAATTIEAISERSDVPSATVYRLFASKLGILKALLDTSIAGDDQGLTLQDRPEIAHLLSEADPQKLLAGMAAICAAINARSNDLHRILVSAGTADPDAASLLADYTKKRDVGQGLISATLAEAGALRPGVPEGDAADIVHALMSPELYRLLVIDRDWPPERYQSWLASVLIDTLLPPRQEKPPPPGRSKLQPPG
jgi:AcrR family transcriptional regulator